MFPKNKNIFSHNLTTGNEIDTITSNLLTLYVFPVAPKMSFYQDKCIRILSCVPRLLESGIVLQSFFLPHATDAEEYSHVIECLSAWYV